MEKTELIEGQFASSRGQRQGTCDEDVATQAINQAALLLCHYCKQPLLTNWHFCPQCGGVTAVADMRSFEDDS
jgi:hypothetical protein